MGITLPSKRNATLDRVDLTQKEVGNTKEARIRIKIGEFLPHSVSKELQHFWSCLYQWIWGYVQISHDPRSHDPDPGPQEKFMKKSCVSFETEFIMKHLTCTVGRTSYERWNPNKPGLIVDKSRDVFSCISYRGIVLWIHCNSVSLYII